MSKSFIALGLLMIGSFAQAKSVVVCNSERSLTVTVEKMNEGLKSPIRLPLVRQASLQEPLQVSAPAVGAINPGGNTPEYMLCVTVSEVQ